jgi:hypothetical protein
MSWQRFSSFIDAQRELKGVTHLYRQAYPWTSRSAVRISLSNTYISAAAFALSEAIMGTFIKMAEIALVPASVITCKIKPVGSVFSL